jgi:pimeloyl-ACP methyl ester carboxylesterase
MDDSGDALPVAPGAGVLLLHGISRSAISMHLIERALRAEGYAVLNLTYNSRRQSLEEIAAAIAPKVTEFAAGLSGPLHIITHSMGGLVARVLLALDRPFRPANLGRVVMLAPPNSGSEIADLLQGNWFYRQWFGPAGAQLVTRRDAHLRRLLGRTDFELGIIAGTRSIYPVASLLLPHPSDGRVSVKATRDARAADHIALPVSHPLIVLDRRAIAQALAFLRDGRFERGQSA